jgi:hypothetical protein
MHSHSLVTKRLLGEFPKEPPYRTTPDRTAPDHTGPNPARPCHTPPGHTTPNPTLPHLALPNQTYEEHLNHAIATKDTEFRASEAPLVYAICKTLHQNKDGKQKDLVEKARKTLEGIIGPGKPLIATLSQAIYHTTGGGAFIHYHNHLEKYTNLPAEMTGPDGFITDPGIEVNDYVHNLLHTFDSMHAINNIFKWITGQETDVIRLNKDPATIEIYAVALGTSGNPRFHLFAFEGQLERPALGVCRIT